MPPKSKLSKQDIIEVAVDIVRKQGEQGLNARSIATALGCSTQPIFSNFTSMEELYFCVIQRAEEINKAYIDTEISRGEFPSYKASGMAYIRFAKEEKEIFKLLYMRDRQSEDIPKEHALTNQMESLVQDNTGLDGDGAKLFHLEMWACVHGIATMFATGFLDLQWELVSQMLTDIFQGLSNRYTKG